MADDPNIRGADDRKRININQPYEIRHWARKFNVTRRELREAVEKVGPSVAKVQAELASRAHGAHQADEAAAGPSQDLNNRLPGGNGDREPT